MCGVSIYRMSDGRMMGEMILRGVSASIFNTA